MTIGLFPPNRQCKLLRGLASRCDESVDQWEKLGHQHGEQITALAERQLQDKAQLKQQSEAQLRTFLQNWDVQDESSTADYERDVLETRVSLNRLGVEFRRRHRRGLGEIDRAHQESKEKAKKAYETKKLLPGKQKARDNNRLNAGWNQINEQLEQGRDIALKRLQVLNDPPPVSESYEKPKSVDEACDRLGKHVTACDERIRKLNEDFAVKFLESIYIFLAMLGASVVGAGITYLIGPELLLVWIVGAAVVSPILVGVTLFAVFTPRMKRFTREWYPAIEQHAVDAVALVKDGQELAAEAATAFAKKLKDDHVTTLRNADEARVNQIATLERELKEEQRTKEASLRNRLDELDNSYNESVQKLETTHGAEFNRISEVHKAQLAKASENRAYARKQLTDTQRNEDDAVSKRIREGLRQGLGRIEQACDQLQQLYPDWKQVASGLTGTAGSLSIIPLGYLDVGDYLNKSVASTYTKTDTAEVHALADSEGEIYQRPSMPISNALSESLPDRMPVALASSQHSGLLIDCPGGINGQVVELIQAVLWRLFSAMTPGSVKMVFLDPIGRGQTFSSLMALSDHDPALVGHRAWTQPNQIESRLAELTQHMEDVLQTYLRDNYATIDEYNAQAGSMAEPYRIVSAIGIPAGLTPSGYENLRALLENGRRCGIMTILVRDTDANWPHDFAALPTDHLLHLKVDKNGDLRHTDPLLSQLPFRTIEPPQASLIAKLTGEVGRGAVAARRVEIPFDEVMPSSLYNDGDSADGIDIPLGQQGAGRLLPMQLGEGVRQHMLVAGKTGSGKSTLLHTIITAGALKYSPDQLHLYMLDFKKGVEFKLYADEQLPHARVIGIESEREFGQSVLQRLDRELVQRGELFRAAGVQEVGEYRRKTGETMPRIMLVVDEFQELFVRDDRIAQDCTMLLDRLVRQGRSFGMHVILSSQSLAGAYSLPRNTLGQMAVRVALQCSESDALVILAEDNNAARLLSRPGEAIYNDEGGLIEGNQPFQVGWLDHDRHRDLLTATRERYPTAQETHGPTVVFEGNQPAKWSRAVAASVLEVDPAKKAHPEDGFKGLLGESVAIGPPVSLTLNPQPGRNLMVVSGDADLTRDVLGITIPSMYGAVLDQGKKLRVIMLDGRRTGGESASPAEFAKESGVPIEHVKPRDAERALSEIAQLIEERNKMDVPENEDPILVVVDPLERFRDLRQDESSFSFSLDSTAPKQTASSLLQMILRDGPPAAIHVIICCGGPESISRWLPRQSQHDLELSILGRMSISDSSQLIDSPEAGRLSPASMLVYDDSSGQIDKFRVYDLPKPDDMRGWIESQIE